MGLFSGRLRISGSNNFRDWFHFDAARPTKKKAIVLETNFKIYRRLWITPEKHDKVFSILKKISLIFIHIFIQNIAQNIQGNNCYMS